MNTTATYIAAQTAKAIKTGYNRQNWLDHKPEIVRVLNELQPDIPDDGSTGFLAYDVNGHPRMKMRTGRFLTRKLKLNSGLLSDTSIQHIAAQINTKLFDSADITRLDKGSQITKNYGDSIGGDSCMTGCNANYTKLYESNPDKIQQLVMISINDSARAIIHKLDNGEHHMSRVYSTSEDLKQRMRNYAHKQGWYYKNCGCTYWYGEQIRDYKPLVVSGLDFTEGEIPFADSLIGYRVENGKLTMLHTSAEHYEGELQSTCGQLDDDCECSCCGGTISGDDVHCGGDEYYCNNCYCENFSYCEDCDETYRNDGCMYIESISRTICDNCLSNNYVSCDDCSDYYPNDRIYSVDDGDKSICNNCLENYSYCNDCGDYFSDLECIEDEYFCSDCANDKVKLIPIDDCEGQLLLQTE